MSRRMIILLILAVLIGLIHVAPATAAIRDGVRWSVGCDGFTSFGGGIVLDRNNTGVGRESFTIAAVDGNGNVIYGPLTESFFVGGRVYISEGVFFPYAAEPTANPILVTITSLAGNGFAEQVVYAVIGQCETLPSAAAVTAEGLIFVEQELIVVDGTTSGSVPLNIDPPRPINPEGISRLPAELVGGFGFVIANTGSLNIRSGDGPEYTLVGRVVSGTEMIVLGRNDDRSWWFVQVGEIRGWVNATLVFIRGDLTNVPVVPVEGQILLPRLYLFSSRGLQLAPLTNALTVCFIEGDLEYYIVGKNRDGSWFELEANCGGQTVFGWVPAEAGAIRNDGDLPIPVTWND